MFIGGCSKREKYILNECRLFFGLSYCEFIFSNVAQDFRVLYRCACSSSHRCIVKQMIRNGSDDDLTSQGSQAVKIHTFPHPIF